MIFILDILLILNIWLAFKYSKYLISPQILMSIGFLLASLIATLYYQEWHMDSFSPVTVLCIGCGTLLFTLTCILTQRKYNNISESSYREILNKKRSLIFMLSAIVLAAFVVQKELAFYRGHFGGVDFSNMVFMIRIAGFEDENSIKLPKWLARLETLSVYFSLFAYLILAYSIVEKWGKKYYILGIVYLGIMIFDGLLTGAKGNMVSPIVRFLIIIIYVIYLKRGSLNLNFKKISIIVGISFLLLGGLKTISTFIGRQTDDTDNSSMVAEYLGAEIKNMDIVVQGVSHNLPSNNLLGYTLRDLYEDLEINNNFSYEYQSIGNFPLGNVYTQYYSFYQDLGILGCLIIPIFMALICMLFYNFCIKGLKNGKIVSLSLMFYSGLAYSITMSFFDSYTLNSTISVYFIKMWLVAFSIFYFIIKKILIQKAK